MLVLFKFLRLLVKTLTDDGKYSLFYRDNLTPQIQILLSQKPKTFSKLSSETLKPTLNFEDFQKKVEPHSQCSSQINVSKKGDQLNACKIPFQRCLSQQTWKKGPKAVEICTKLVLPYLFIPLHIIRLERIYVSALQILTTVS